MSQKPRAATIQCTTEWWLALIGKNAYESVIGKVQKKQITQKINFLSNVPCLSYLGKTTLGRFSYYFDEVKYV